MIAQRCIYGFLKEYNELFEKYNKIWDKVSNSIKKGFDGKHLNSRKYLITKVKCYRGETVTMLYNSKVPNEVPQNSISNVEPK